jgi:hypothetical protein
MNILPITRSLVVRCGVPFRVAMTMIMLLERVLHYYATAIVAQHCPCPYKETLLPKTHEPIGTRFVSDLPTFVQS